VSEDNRLLLLGTMNCRIIVVNLVNKSVVKTISEVHSGPILALYFAEELDHSRYLFYSTAGDAKIMTIDLEIRELLSFVHLNFKAQQMFLS
jgi:hypothetical protein